ncbi:hypothetical protein [Pedobacter yulinensis]|uniref:hypothetical protein n=1 Tax=Pedobacter yulinensis TaxID=2126353 RepID=UPI0013A63E26|nr:hypothetical protein [Pedobacter yulinensis]
MMMMTAATAGAQTDQQLFDSIASHALALSRTQLHYKIVAGYIVIFGKFIYG